MRGTCAEPMVRPTGPTVAKQAKRKGMNKSEGLDALRLWPKEDHIAMSAASE